MKKVTVREMFNFYDLTLRKTVRNKDKLIRFEMHKSEYIRYIVDVLNGKEKLIHYYNIFLIYEPKPRLIMSLNMPEKVINHYFTTNYLIPKLDKLLDDRNVATRVGKGTDYALSLVRKYIEYYKRCNEKFYVLKIDISKFFYKIDHEKLKDMLKDDLSYDEYLFACKIIDSTNYDYINDKINSILNKNPGLILPLYEYGKGLPIGNLSSQCLSVYYLNRLDHFIIHDLHLKNYVRYMDDFLIFSNDRDYLYRCKYIIVDKLINEYKLSVNKKKTFIIDGKIGFTFLGYKFMIRNNRTIMIVKKSSLRSMKKRVKRNKNLYERGEITFEKYFSSLINYYFSYRASKMKIRRFINGDVA